MAPVNEALQLLRQAQTYFFAKPPDYAAAEMALRKAMEISQDWGEPFHWLGSVLERRRDLQGAVDAYRRAIVLLVGDARPLIALGRLQSDFGLHDEAITLLQTGISLGPHYAEADARLMLAEALERADKVDEAVAQWQIVAAMPSLYPSYGKPMKEANRQLSKHRKS